ncbi:MAG: 2-isopropylmalate synthase [Candidatus Margulisiibacteriota bacterium]|jgi:2-isopropylmalate synthase
MKRIIKIFDTTLRDGEQSPGCSMNKEEKLEIARQLERLNVDIIEAGFAISSPGDFESIELIAKEVRKPIICSLARAKDKDIEAAAKALKKAAHPRIHVFLATSSIHMQHKLKMTPDEVVETAVSAVKLAKSFMSDVQFSCEDAGRSDWDFLVRVLTEVIKAGAVTLNIPDTVGFQTPYEFGELIKYLLTNTRGIEKTTVAMHCHNDLGLASANSLAAVLNGANQIECTMNGIGERAGNTALEEVVMALKVRESLFQAETNIKTDELLKTSRLVANITGSLVQPNKAIVGANAFSHEAGIHQDGVLKERTTYEIMDARTIGLKENQLVLGKHSGRHAFVSKMHDLGYSLSKEEIEKAFERFKLLADRKKEVSDKDIESIVADEIYQANEIYKLKYVQVVSGNTTMPTATVQLVKQNGDLIEGSEIGEGPIDAIYKVINNLVEDKINLLDFVIHSVSGGTDALGEVTVRICEGEKIFTGRGSDMDVLVASAKAYVAAINKMLN